MNKELSTDFPSVGLQLSGVPRPLARLFEGVLRIVRREKVSVAEVVNFNSVQKVSQDAQPTPAEDRMVVWEDTDATSTNPTHYIVVNFGGTVVTFASEEVVP